MPALAVVCVEVKTTKNELQFPKYAAHTPAAHADIPPIPLYSTMCLAWIHAKMLACLGKPPQKLVAGRGEVRAFQRQVSSAGASGNLSNKEAQRHARAWLL